MTSRNRPSAEAPAHARQTVTIPADRVGYLITTAARAPSVHNTQPLEAATIRALIRTRLALPGAPQMLLQLGLAHTTQATARRPPAELMEP